MGVLTALEQHVLRRGAGHIGRASRSALAEEDPSVLDEQLALELVAAMTLACAG